MSRNNNEQPAIRPARPDDARILAELVNHAGEGLPLYLWGKIAPEGISAWDVGAERAAREQGSFSYRNARIIEHEGNPAGTLIGYEIADDPEPAPQDLPAMFVPLVDLEGLAPGTWYVNVVAVLPRYRGLGLGTRLLALAEETAAHLGKRGLSLIVADNNVSARRLYERQGYVEAASRPIVKDGWQTEGENWVLMTKTI